MGKTVKLLITDSYYGVFDLLTDELKGKTNNVEQKNFVFCEEKISLMAERAICDKFVGTFNTEVYSFGNYLKSRKNVDALTREGSAMAVKRILADLELSVLKAGKAELAPALFDLIVQLKSANVTPAMLESALDSLSGDRAKKIGDVAKVYSAYEHFIKDNGFTDQSGILSFLPEVIENDQRIKSANVYLLGYNSWTAQAREGIKKLILNANQVTAILTGGENKYLYLNETVGAFKDICKGLNVKVTEKSFSSYDFDEVKYLSKALFNPLRENHSQTSTLKIKKVEAKTQEDECKFIADYIANSVRKGARFKEFTVAVPDVATYGKKLRYYFNLLNIPYFIDEKVNPCCHPLIRLILSYFDVFVKNFDRFAVCEFFKNPLYCDDKELTDFVETYLVKTNVNYNGFKRPFTVGDETEVARAEEFRKPLVSVLDGFDLQGMLKKLNVKEKLTAFTEKLKGAGEYITAEVNSQVYDAVMKILDDMDKIFSGAKVKPVDLKNVFKSGVTALQLSIIPQYGDAVFVGDYRRTALAKAGTLFSVGLTADVPSSKDDVAVLNDDDIAALNGKIFIDPTVRIINLRMKENFGVAMLSFSDRLFVSCPDIDAGGKKTVKSEYLIQVEKTYDVKKVFADAILRENESARYLTEKQGAISFAADCRAFRKSPISDSSFPFASAFNSLGENGLPKRILESANSEFSQKIHLENVSALPDGASPTQVENYYECPYKAFASRILKIKEIDQGKLDPSTAGTFMHAVMERYFTDFKNGLIKDKSSSDESLNKAISEITEDPKYKRFYENKESAAIIKRVIEEAEKYCYKSYLNIIAPKLNRKFVPKELEKFIEYELPSGFKVKGVIDRVDALTEDGKEVEIDGKKAIRIVDYKSGKADDSDKSLYVGKKLQLYLYANNFKDDSIVGLYYLPIKDEYVKQEDKSSFMAIGKTLNDQSVVEVTDAKDENGLPFAETSRLYSNRKNPEVRTVSSSVIEGCISYAVKMCENAVKQMKEGVIVASPYADACKYCNYKAICGSCVESGRKVSDRLNSSDIAEIVNGEKDE